MTYEPKNYVYWIFGVRNKRRDDLIIHLKSKGVATGVHYMPLPLHPLFRPYENGCEISKKIWKSFITLPLFAELTDEEIDYIIDVLTDFDKKY